MDVLGNARLPFRRRRPRVYLHIGSSKTGTTYLQALMAGNRAALARAGVLFPGERWAMQVQAVREVMAASRTSEPDSETAPAWAQLRDEVLAHRGRASVISMEYLSFADPERAARIVGSFGDADVHVILTVRDATYTIPGQWQTSCRNGGLVPYPHHVRAVRRSLKDPPAHAGRAYRIFQRTQGIPRMIEVWQPQVAPGNFHVVTVPPKGSDPMLLWRRFAKVIGVRPGLCTQRPTDSNPSMGYPSTELIRLMNLRLGGVERADYFKIVRQYLARQVLAPRAPQERRLELDAAGVQLARRWNRRVREALHDSGVKVVGSPDDLPVEPDATSPPDTVAPPSDEELLAAADTARAGLVALAADLEAGRSLEHAGGFVGDEDHDDHGVDEDHEGEGPRGSEDGRNAAPAADAELSPVDGAVEELAELVRRCIALSKAPDGLSPAASR